MTDKDKLITESRMPKVGIFWFLGDEIIEFAQDQTAVPVNHVGFKDSPWDHYAVWDKVVKVYPQLQGKEYFDIPRGRVLYNTKDDMYHIITSTALANDQKKINKVMRAFSLPIRNTKAITDPHYEDVADFD